MRTSVLLRTLLLSREVRMLPTCIARVSEVERGERREREERREESAGCRAQGALERSENAAHLHRTVCCSQVSRVRRGQRREERGEGRAQNAGCKYSHSKDGALLSSEQSGERERERERERENNGARTITANTEEGLGPRRISKTRAPPHAKHSSISAAAHRSLVLGTLQSLGLYSTRGPTNGGCTHLKRVFSSSVAGGSSNFSLFALTSALYSLFATSAILPGGWEKGAPRPYVGRMGFWITQYLCTSTFRTGLCT